ncbi:MAG: T9SS type A sorting domain-containing protein [Bacteroidota bacterium]
MFTKNQKPMFLNKLKTPLACLLLLFLSFNLSADISDLLPTPSETTEEVKCDCDIMSESFNIFFRERCTAILSFEDFWEPCIERAQWTINGFVYSTDLNPKPYEFCSSGKQEICLTLTLVTGETCTFCKTIEVECPRCCSCDYIQSLIKRTPAGPCALDFEIAPEAEECIKDLKWDIGGTVFSSTFDPPAVSFSNPGPHTVCVKVALRNGEDCLICQDYLLEKCEEGCNCERIAAGIKMGTPENCKIDFKLDPDLEKCVRDLKWAINGNGYSDQFCPPTYEFPGSGSYEICLFVVLQDGTECRFCYRFDVECPNECNCEKIKAGIKIGSVNRDSCTVQFKLDPDLEECVKGLKWIVDGDSYSDEFCPPAFQLPGSGSYEICLFVVLADGTECRFCEKIEADCPEDCNCEKVKAGIKIDKPDPDSCSINFKLDPELKNCVKALKWVIDGDSYSDEFCPDTYFFPGSGTYEICIYVVLIDGTECKFCYKVDVDCKDCNCERVKAGIKADRPSKCSIDLGLDPALENCVRSVRWFVDGALISTAFDPATYTFPASGVYEICVVVVLADGTVCEFCEKVKADCPCDCEAVKSDINIRRVLPCGLDFFLDEAQRECVRDLKWTVDGSGYSGDFNPPVLNLSGAGTVEICLFVVLADGTQCEFCTKVDYNCRFEQGKTIEEANIQFQDIPADFKVYPNPSNGIFTLELEHMGRATLQITNLQGKLLYSKVINSAQNVLKEEVDISQFGSGIYLISLDLGDQVLTRKVNVSINN